MDLFSFLLITGGLLLVVLIILIVVLAVDPVERVPKRRVKQNLDKIKKQIDDI